MTESPFMTLAGRAEAETRVKGSTFLALAAPARDEEGAREVLAEVQKAHFSATHNCSAWRLHDGVWRASDDGEPSGSAGLPILAAIDGAGVTDCIVVVTRYYGGTRLGVGGLVRAYGEAAALALEGAPRLRAVPAARLRIRYPYDRTSAIMRVIERAGTFSVDHGYSGGGNEGEVTFTVALSGEEALHVELTEATGGAVLAQRVGVEIVHLPA